MKERCRSPTRRKASSGVKGKSANGTRLPSADRDKITRILFYNFSDACQEDLRMYVKLTARERLEIENRLLREMAERYARLIQKQKTETATARVRAEYRNNA